MKASDFEYSLNRLKDEKVASPGGWILQNVENFKAINDSIFEIKLTKSFPAFLGLLSMKYASVVPKEIIESPNHDFRTQPIGTGPFQFKFWEENVKLVLRRNPIYFEKDENGKQLPYLEAVAITFLPDKQSGFLEFIQGKIDFISGLDPSYKDEILTQSGQLQEKYKNDVNMITGPYLNTEYLGFRMDGSDKTVLDKRIRQALNYGFDRQKLVTYLRNGMGTPAINGIIPAGLPGFEVGVWHGLYAPKGTPKPIIDRLSKSLQTALKDPAVISRFAELGTEPVPQDQATPAALRKHLDAEIARWKPIIDKAGQYAD